MRRQKRKKKCLIFACKRLLQTDMRRHRCRRGPGEGSRQVQPPAHPASCSIPSLGGVAHTLPPSQDETPPAKDLTQGHISCCPHMQLWGRETSAITHHAQDPASLPVVPRQREGTGVGWLPPHIPEPSAPRAAGSRRRGSGAARLHRRFFFPHKLRPRRKPAPGKN